MPVVTITAPDAGDTTVLVAEVAERMAAALELAPDDVIALHLPTGASSVDTDPLRRSAWVIVAAHGSDRGERTEPALAAAEDAVRRWASAAGLDLRGVWTEWVLPRAAG